jgi:single-strand selective monofunctional uracil DNA glycosylase
MTAPIIAAARELARRADRLRFEEPVRYVYNPLVYARLPHEEYLERYAASPKRVIFLGMNPGPWGMAQTGVPFGEVASVRDWLGITGEVGQPRRPHARLAVSGFACARSEVSGRRLWGLMRAHYGSAEAFSKEAFVSNYCPLLFLDASGRNITPDRIHRDDREPLYSLCDRFLRIVVRTLRPEWLVGMGAFAARRIAVLDGLGIAVLGGLGIDVLDGSGADSAVSGGRAGMRAGPIRIASILHPSPASPSANRDWAAQAGGALTELGIW